MLSVTKQYHFEAAHFLPDHDGKCKRMHGHSYRVEVTVTGPVITEGPKSGMVMDFSDLDAIMDPLIASVDHQVLNEVGSLFQPPTAEKLVLLFADSLQSNLAWDAPMRAAVGLRVTRVRVWETERGSAEWTEDPHD